MIASLQNAPFPAGDPMVSSETGKGQRLMGMITTSWQLFLSTLLQVVNTCPNVVGQATHEDVGAAVSTTDLTDGTFGAGLYRLNYYQRVTTAAGVSSTVVLTFSWTDGAVVQSITATNSTNVTNITLRGTLMIYSDRASPITYAASYASNAANVMRHKFYVVLERVAAA